MIRIRSSVRVAIPIVWAMAMAGARWFDPWMTIGPAAAILAGIVLASDDALIRRLLRPSTRSIVLAAMAAAAMIATTDFLFRPAVQSIPAIGAKTTEIYADFLAGRTTAVVLAFVMPLIVAEEILWRGAVQEAVRLKSQWATVLISAIIYAAAHVPLGSMLLVAVAFICGLYWAGLRSLSGSLLPSLVAHLAWDVALILVPMTPHSALQ